MILRISLLFIFFQFSSFAQQVQFSVDETSSYIEYEGKHLLHDWSGINKKIKGVIISDESSGKFTKIALLANVKDFDSNNSGRDVHSLEVLEALQFPEVKFYSAQILQSSDEISFIGSLEFHGVTIEKKVQAKVMEIENQILFSGEFQLTPSDFGIELPSFMTVKMKDQLDFNFRIVINK